MRCDICSKDFLFLNFIGKDNVCTNCIARHTVFKEIKTVGEARLKKALRVFPVRSFEDLKMIKEHEVEDVEKMPDKETVKVKKNKAVKARPVEGASVEGIKADDDIIDPIDEMDQLW